MVSCLLRICRSILMYGLISGLFLPYARADDRPFNNSANYGGTGLMEIPNARVLEENEIRFGVAQADPYRWYTGAFGVFPGLEVDFRLTQVLGATIRRKGWEGYGDDKDKCLDFKYQILPESRWFPAVAVGMHDIHGTEKFRATYVTTSRQIFPFDFTFGIGTGRLKGDTSMLLLDRFGPFGGIEMALTDRLQLMAEYNPILYTDRWGTDRRRVEDVSSHINTGVRIKIYEGVRLTASWQRGNTFGAMLTLRTPLGKPLLRKKPDHPPLAPVDTRPFRERDVKKMVMGLQDVISRKGFSNVMVSTNGVNLVIEFENTKYLSDEKAIGRVLRNVLIYTPEDTEKLIVICKRFDLDVLKVTVCPRVLADFFAGKIDAEVFARHIGVEPAKTGTEIPPGSITSGDPPKVRATLGIKPDFEPYLNDPSGFFKFRAGIEPYARYYPWAGAVADARMSIPFYSNVSTSNPTLKGDEVVRSDFTDYLSKDISIDKLMFTQMAHLSDQTFGSVSVGALEYMYTGASVQILHYIGEGRLALGIQGDFGIRRKPGELLGVKDFTAYDVLGNFYYSVPYVNVVLGAQVGQFMAKDRGVRLTVSREYDTGAMCGAWYTLTNTSELSSFNKGYRDKGVFVSLPVEMFKTTPDPRRYNYAFTPWTRDVGQTIETTYDLYGTAFGLLPFNFKKNIDRLKE